MQRMIRVFRSTRASPALVLIAFTIQVITKQSGLSNIQFIVSWVRIYILFLSMKISHNLEKYWRCFDVLSVLPLSIRFSYLSHFRAMKAQASLRKFAARISQVKVEDSYKIFFHLIHYFPINVFSVMSRRVFLGKY